MARKQKMNYDDILLLREKGLGAKKIAEIYGVNRNSVGFVLQADRLAAEGDLDGLLRLRKNYGSVVDWACAKHNISLETPVTPEEPTESEPKEEPTESEPKKDLDNTAMAFVQLAEGLRALTSAVQAIDQRLSAMQMTQQGLRGELTEHIRKVVETINVNGDIITKEHNRAIDLLGGIKCNTRKRGSNDAG